MDGSPAGAQGLPCLLVGGLRGAEHTPPLPEPLHAVTSLSKRPRALELGLCVLWWTLGAAAQQAGFACEEAAGTRDVNSAAHPAAALSLSSPELCTLKCFRPSFLGNCSLIETRPSLSLTHGPLGCTGHQRAGPRAPSYPTLCSVNPLAPVGGQGGCPRSSPAQGASLLPTCQLEEASAWPAPAASSAMVSGGGGARGFGHLHQPGPGASDARCLCERQPSA